MTPPVQTYRLQLARGSFTLADAERIVPYLADLGITHLYLSPVLRSRPGSTHGYDVVDPLRVDPELGGEPALRALADAAHGNGMGLVLDIVPNHMAASTENPWWNSVLEHGRSSPFADMFDIDWTAAGPPGTDRVLLPVLGEPYGATLATGGIRVGLSGEPSFVVTTAGRDLPTDPGTWGELLAGFADAEAATLRNQCDALGAASESWREPGRARRARLLRRRLASWLSSAAASRHEVEHRVAALDTDQLHALLERQPYRLAHWRLACEVSGYRRFFDISDLVAVRADDVSVFRRMHRTVLRLVREGVVDGLRLDHVDGLRDPLQYLRRLNDAIRAARAGEERRDDFWLVVEKILCGDEVLPRAWPIAGTTGYEFAAALDRVLVDPDGLTRLTDAYRSSVPDAVPFAKTSYRARRAVLMTLFAGELARLVANLRGLAAADKSARDLLPSEVHDALVTATASLPVYRTYVREAEPPDDRGWRESIEEGLAAARQHEPRLRDALQFLEHTLLPPWTETELGFVCAWQQLTGPVMAKGVEDCALYRDCRLLSLNEVGAEPEPDPELMTAAAFHRRMQQNAAHWPGTLNATSTHDSKRGEDARCRLHVLAEIPGDWTRAASRWHEWNRWASAGTAPDEVEEMLLYQTLLGAWPAEALGREASRRFTERVARYCVKAAREARRNTSWHRQNEAHERALVEFTERVLELSSRSAQFLVDFHALLEPVAFWGAMTSLAMVAVKAAAPGVFDLYQGCELWNLSMVDPDNRLPVDFARRRKLLDGLGPPAGGLCRELLASWPDGRVKLHATRCALALRRDHAAARDGDHVPLEVRGAEAARVLAFARRPRDDGAWVLCVAPLRAAALSSDRVPPLGVDAWQNTELVLPSHAPRRWCDAFTAASHEVVAGSRLPLAQLLSDFPAALLGSASG